MALMNYLKERGTNQLYKLGGGGYYQKYSGDTGGQAPTDVNSIADYYSTQAKEQTDPYYNQRTTETTTRSNADLASTADRLKALYTDQGMGNSSFYTGADTSNTNINKQNLSSNLAEIEKARSSEYNSIFNKYSDTQSAGFQRDEDMRIAAEKAAQDRADREQERIWQEKQNELNYRAALASASSKGSGTTKKPTATEIKGSLLSNISDGLQEIIDQGFPKYATEQMGNELYDLYKQYGYTKDQVFKLIYDYRTELEKKYTF
jgi:hypothetical protein